MSAPTIFRCSHPGCNYSSPTKAYYTQHVKRTHTAPGGYSCPMCGVKLKNRWYAENRHIDVCEGVHVGLEVSFTMDGATEGSMPDGFTYKRGRTDFEVPDYVHQPFLPTERERQIMEWGFAKGEWVPPKEEVIPWYIDSKGNQWVHVRKLEEDEEQDDAQPEKEFLNYFEEQQDQWVHEQQQQNEQVGAQPEEHPLKYFEEQHAQWVREQPFLTQLQQPRAPYISPYISTYIGLPTGPHPSQQANPDPEFEDTTFEEVENEGEDNAMQGDTEMTDGDVDALFEDVDMDESY